MTLAATAETLKPCCGWARAIATPAEEFSTTPLPLLAGHIPPGLRGTLYRNGPARLERHGVRVGHWFDGDGAILRVHFHNGAAEATYRYIQTAGWQTEEAIDQYLYRGYGSLPPGSVWQRWRAQVKNVANTSVLALPDRLLALWEGGLPHRLNLETLATQGVDNLQSLRPTDTFSAHPKRHPRTGQIFNFGVKAGGNATLKLYRCSPKGLVEQTATLELTGIPLVHDFVLADRHLVFCVPPVRLNPLPAVFGLQSFSDALRWQPQTGTQVIVVDADSFEVTAWNQVDPWYQWHFGHSQLLPDGSLTFDVVRYPDFATNQYLKEIASGQVTTPAEAQLWQYRLDPQTGKILESNCLLDRHCEFPVVWPDSNHSEGPLTYLNLHRTLPTPPGELFEAIGQFNPRTHTLALADGGAGYYPSEPIPAQDSNHPPQHWVLTVVYNS
ncbi:MAG TPA: carotenoid oxygenase family protein, partial [Leptolyngbyaceae cyanobacterium M65_K2018_010]|nr:carotenoid oxygenase family protein [Leptolyngbyaceae cyanobacterium M65_K2018_010]